MVEVHGLDITRICGEAGGGAMSASLARLPRWQALACAAVLILATVLTSCGRKDATDAIAALNRANRELLTKSGWGFRVDEDIEWLTQLGRGDSRAWEVIVARSGILDVQIAFGQAAQATVAVPLEPGGHVHVVFRPRLGESGLVDHRWSEAESGKSRPIGWTSWAVSSERWGGCLTVLTSSREGQRIDVTTEGADRVEWSGLRGQWTTLQRPYFREALSGTEVEGTPMGTLAIPASARVTGEIVSALPSGRLLAAPDAADPTSNASEPQLLTGMAFPMTPTATIRLCEFTWSTRSASDVAPVEVGTWTVSVRLRPGAGEASAEK